VTRWARIFQLDGGTMALHRRIRLSEASGVTVVEFLDHKILDAGIIQELADEMYALVDKDGVKSLLLDFKNVEFLSSAALNKLIMLDKKVKEHQGRLKLCNLEPGIREVFVITRLNQLFQIKGTVQEALRDF
jgi:anti-sigma B factor antagonist